MTSHHFVDDPRCAGEVRRFHTVPCHRQQTVAEHSWQVARVLLAIWPDAPRHLLVHAVVHDVGEVQTGDVPYPAKRTMGIKDALTKAETDAHLGMCAPWRLPPPANLSPLEWTVFKLAEFVEMLEFAYGECELGNVHSALIVQRCESAIEELTNKLKEVLDEENAILRGLIAYLSRRNNVHRRRMGEI